MAARQQSLLEQGWYSDNWLSRLLIPLSWLFALVSRSRRRTSQRIANKHRLPVPVVVVGNISVGGTGKTPLLITLVSALRQAGFRPGVISRGYGSEAPQYPFLVNAETAAEQGGDEPVLIASQCQCPVVVDPNRLQAAEYLLTHSDCNVILSDDGIQHYRLPRDIEIAVIDGSRGFGNGRLLPAGPLREPVSRLGNVDFVISNGQLSQQLKGDLQAVDVGTDVVANVVTMTVEPLPQLRSLNGNEAPVAARDWPYLRREVHAVAGIGNPQRFVDSLQQSGFVPHLHAFPDHHKYRAEELQLSPRRPLVMTAKDAVKCRSLVTTEDDCWVLDVAANVPQSWLDNLISKIKVISTKTL